MLCVSNFFQGYHRASNQIVIISQTNTIIEIKNRDSIVIQAQPRPTMVDRASSPIRWMGVEKETQTSDFDHRSIKRPPVNQPEIARFLRMQRFAVENEGRPYYQQN